MSLIYRLHQPSHHNYYCPLPYHYPTRIATKWLTFGIMSTLPYSTLSMALAILLLLLLLHRAVSFVTSFPASHPFAITARRVWTILNTPFVTKMAGTLAFFLVYYWSVECESPTEADATSTTTSATYTYIGRCCCFGYAGGTCGALY